VEVEHPLETVKLKNVKIQFPIPIFKELSENDINTIPTLKAQDFLCTQILSKLIVIGRVCIDNRLFKSAPWRWLLATILEVSGWGQSKAENGLLDSKAQERKWFLVTFHLGGMGENQLFLHLDPLKLLSAFPFASYLNNYGLICQFYQEVRSFRSSPGL
jgi:hypothetical protein